MKTFRLWIFQDNVGYCILDVINVMQSNAHCVLIFDVLLDNTSIHFYDRVSMSLKIYENLNNSIQNGRISGKSVCITSNEQLALKCLEEHDY